MPAWLRTLAATSVVVLGACFAVGYYQQAWLLWRHFGYSGSPYAFYTYYELLLAGLKSLYLQLGWSLPEAALATWVVLRAPRRLRRVLFIALLTPTLLFLVVYWSFSDPVPTTLLVWLQDSRVFLGLPFLLSLLVLELHRGQLTPPLSSRARNWAIGVFLFYAFYPVVATCQYPFRIFMVPARVFLVNGGYLQNLHWISSRDGQHYFGDFYGHRIVVIRSDRVERMELSVRLDKDGR